MQKSSFALGSALALLLTTVATATAQPAPGGVKWTVYPILAFVPLDTNIDVELPPFEGGGGGDIIESQFDGAFVGGFSVAGGRWRGDLNFLWAAVGGDRLETPVLTVDADVFYFHATGGWKVVKDLYVTGGLRRLALKYDIKLGNRPNFERKPGIWDPLVGLGWHSDAGERLEVHATFEGGGFGVGTDVDLGGSFRLDWKPVRHFGLTGGYQLLYFKLSDDVLSRAFTVEQLLHGPVVGFGLYF